jgi:hypothetical protein
MFAAKRENVCLAFRAMSFSQTGCIADGSGIGYLP